jgi:hypothetical protein
MMPEHADKLRRPQTDRTAERLIDVNKGSQDPSSRESIVSMVGSDAHASSHDNQISRRSHKRLKFDVFAERQLRISEQRSRQTSKRHG